MKNLLLTGLAFFAISNISHAECFSVSLKSGDEKICVKEVIDRGNEIELIDIQSSHLSVKANSRNASVICSGTRFQNVSSFTKRKDAYNRMNRIDSEQFTGYTRKVNRLYSVTCH